MSESIYEITCGECTFELKSNGRSGRLEKTEQGWVSQTDEPGREWLRLVMKPDDRIILPVDEGCAFRADDPLIAQLYHSVPFNCRENTMGVILFERAGCYLALAPEETVHAKTEVCLNEAGLCEATIRWTEKPARLHLFAGSLKEVVKAYRELRKAQGYMVTLKEKAEKLPALHRLRRSAVIWPWQDDYERLMYSNREEETELAEGRVHLRVARELKEAGMDDILFGVFFKTDEKALPELSDMGYLSTKYDNYNDVPPDDLCRILPERRVEGCDYLNRRIGDYPDRITVLKDGSLCTAWQLDGLDGKRHSQYTMCPKCALEAMKREIPQETKGKGYSARFIDVFGGGLTECHSQEHPLSREESVHVKNEAFDHLTRLGLIPGTEDGMEAIVPSLCYNEGMASPFFWRYDRLECGRRKAQLFESEDALEWLDRYMLNPERRFPLWELMYRDCVISFPYWGDSLLSCPERAQERLLFAVLFGNPPLYSFFEKNFGRLKPLILKTYAQIQAALERIGDLPMTDYGAVPGKKGLYCSVFGESIKIIVNFADIPMEYEGTTIEAKNYFIKECAR